MRLLPVAGSVAVASVIGTKLAVSIGRSIPGPAYCYTSPHSSGANQLQDAVMSQHLAED